MCVCVFEMCVGGNHKEKNLSAVMNETENSPSIYFWCTTLLPDLKIKPTLSHKWQIYRRTKKAHKWNSQESGNSNKYNSNNNDTEEILYSVLMWSHNKNYTQCSHREKRNTYICVWCIYIWGRREIIKCESALAHFVSHDYGKYWILMHIRFEFHIQHLMRESFRCC